MELKNERMQILEMIEKGAISADEGQRLLQVLIDDDESAQLEIRNNAINPELTSTTFVPEKSESPDHESPTKDFSWNWDNTKVKPEQVNQEAFKEIPPPSLEGRKWNNWWLLPFGFGTVIITLGAALLYWATQTPAYVFWIIITGLLVGLGLIIMLLSWFSRYSPWLHIRVRQRRGKVPQHFALSIPVPLKPILWFVHNLGFLLPHKERGLLNEIVIALSENIASENPLYVQVDEGREGEKVELFIG